MQFLVTFLEGIITFISPCVLPMIPLYILYFAGDRGDDKPSRAVFNSIGFVTGFTVIFVALGIFAGTLGGFLTEYQDAVNIVAGAIVALFGLHYTGLLHIGILDRTAKPNADIRPKGFFSSALFGLVFAIGWSPCTGAFLGSAMLLAASQQSWLTGMLLLLFYSLGLGVPFILCAVLVEQLKGAFDFIKRNYKIINMVCGMLLIAVGILMAVGLFGRLSMLLF